MCLIPPVGCRPRRHCSAITLSARASTSLSVPLNVLTLGASRFSFLLRCFPWSEPNKPNVWLSSIDSNFILLSELTFLLCLLSVPFTLVTFVPLLCLHLEPTCLHVLRCDFYIWIRSDDERWHMRRIIQSRHTLQANGPQDGTNFSSLARPTQILLLPATLPPCPARLCRLASLLRFFNLATTALSRAT